MSCNSCTSTKTLSACAGNLTLGTISSLATAVYIYVKNPAGYVYRQSATSSGAGAVVLNLALPDAGFYHPNGDFEVWVTLASADRESRETVTISSVAYTCFNLSFERTYDANEDSISYTTQTLEAE